jgi:choline dehydrogenase-like flavoprotein
MPPPDMPPPEPEHVGKEKYTFDAIVVGSGITGGWAAKELCERGLDTLLLERGRPVEHVKDYPTASLHPWEPTHRGTLTQEDRQRHPVQSRHFSFREETRHFYADDIDNPYREIQRYDWIRADVLGGRSLLWGRMSFRWSNLDFEANARDGMGPDWPIRYKDIAPWYEHVERFIGISGRAEGIPNLPDSVFQEPMPFNCLEEHLKNHIETAYPDRHFIHSRVANLTRPLPGRNACQYRNLCDRGCPLGAYFSTQSSTLPAALATGKLTVRTHALANQILFDNNSQRATGIEIIDTITGNTYTCKAPLLFLNASTLGTTHLLLNSRSRRFPNGMGNDHDQLGRYLMDHPRTATVAGTIDEYADTYYYGRKPTGYFIPRFVNLNSQEKNYLRGYNCQGNTARLRVQHPDIGTTLKNAVTEPGPWQAGMRAYGECLPYADNRVTLDPTLTDKWGRPALAIDCQFRDNERKMSEDALVTMQEMLQKAGLNNIQVNGSTSHPGNANHEMGTARMGNDPKTSVLDKWNRLHTVPNVIVTDGSCMTSSASVNPSLTYMALTARAVDHAVNEYRKGNR